MAFIGIGLAMTFFTMVFIAIGEELFIVVGGHFFIGDFIEPNGDLFDPSGDPTKALLLRNLGVGDKVKVVASDMGVEVMIGR